MKTNISNYLSTTITYALVFLFVYTALSKLFMYDIYVSDLGRSPFIGGVAGPLSILLPAIELLIAAMLMFARTRLYGLYASAALMLLFTLYVAAMLVTEDSLPCTCGGLIRDLTWRQHLVFNIVFTLAAAWATYYQRKNRKDSYNQTNTQSAWNP